MIGIKIQNQVWESTLADLLGEKGEKYQDGRTYEIVITDNFRNTPKNQTTLVLGRDIGMPFTWENLQEKLFTLQQPNFQNKTFIWMPKNRQLIRRKNQMVIQLTQKESEIIAFLATRPDKKATREEILKAVWHYQDDVHTHTLESHIYALRQKLTPDDHQLITSQNSIYMLIS